MGYARNYRANKISPRTAAHLSPAVAYLLNGQRVPVYYHPAETRSFARMVATPIKPLRQITRARMTMAGAPNSRHVARIGRDEKRAQYAAMYGMGAEKIAQMTETPNDRKNRLARERRAAKKIAD